MDPFSLLWLIPILPLAGATLNGVFGKRLSKNVISVIAAGSVGLSFALAIWEFVAMLKVTELPIIRDYFTWIQAGPFQAQAGFMLDHLTGMMILIVTGVGFLIHVYSAGYMAHEEGFYRYFAYLNLFVFFMLTLVMADNFLLMFVGWEGVGLCSYLLIGYYTDRKEAGDAAKKAFITNRVGDWGFVLGLMLVFFLTGSVSFFNKPEHGVTSALQIISTMSVDPFTWHAIFAGGLTSVAVLLFIGAAGKSAQIPLYVWLPDAMAGPTPVSALIHAATMVTAGVY